VDPTLEQQVPDLKAAIVQGGLARLVAQVCALVIRAGSMVLFARLLQPADFGLVGMVAVVTGVLSLFKDFGLSTATVQRAVLTEEQSSSLFWLNLLAGTLLWALTCSLAPFLVAFYTNPPRSVSARPSLGVSYKRGWSSALPLLQRQMRLAALAVLDVAALFAGGVIGATVGHACFDMTLFAARIVALIDATLSCTAGPSRPAVESVCDRSLKK
jgi:O-antigen/teichoic acid export membrane protein